MLAHVAELPRAAPSSTLARVEVPASQDFDVLRVDLRPFTARLTVAWLSVWLALGCSWVFVLVQKLAPDFITGAALGSGVQLTLQGLAVLYLLHVYSAIGKARSPRRGLSPK